MLLIPILVLILIGLFILGKKKNNKNLCIGLGVFVVGLIIYLYNKGDEEENFFFEVSKPRRKCCRGFAGKPTTFDYTSSNDVAEDCPKINNDDPQMGWDGFLGKDPRGLCTKDLPVNVIYNDIV